MLLVSLKESDYVMIGDNIKVSFKQMKGKDHLVLGIDAPRDVPVLRGKAYEEEVAESAISGDSEKQALAGQLRKDYEARRRESQNRRARREGQERRIAAGEIRAYK